MISAALLPDDLLAVLHPAAVLDRDGDGSARLRLPPYLSATPIAIAAELEPAVELLAGRGITADELPELFRQFRDTVGLPGVGRLIGLLRQLQALGAIHYQLRLDAAPFAILMPLATGVSPGQLTVAAGQRYQLSRFAYLHREEDQLLLESPLAGARLALPDPRAAALVARLFTPFEVGELRAAQPEVPADTLAIFLRLLAGMSAIVAADSAADDAEGNPALASWEFHDLLFHTRTRRGRQPGPYGGTYRFLGKIDPPAALPAPTPGRITPLARPDLAPLLETDVPFTRVLEQRRSRRQQHAEPLTVEQLGAFLYRVARVKGSGEHTIGGVARVTTTSRVYPGGGGLYEMDIFLCISHCAGIDPGFYYYEPLQHALRQLADLSAPVERLLRDANTALGLSRSATLPQVLLTYGARFARVAWKYEAIAYSLILKHSGVLQQTMYLVAEAMGLAGCALGAGNADLFAAVAGVDYYAMTSVGEFVLGRRAADDDAHPDQESTC